MVKEWIQPKSKYYKKRKSTNKCACCGKQYPDNLLFSYVDGNNVAITYNSPDLCWRCYNEKYPNDKISFLDLLRYAKLNPTVNVEDKTITIGEKVYSIYNKDEIIAEYNL